MSQNNKENKKSNILYVLIAIFLCMAIVGIIMFINFNKNNEDKDFSYSQLLTSINDGTVEKIEMTEGSTTAKVKLVNEEKEKNVLIPSVDSFIDLVQEKSNNGTQINLIQK